MCEAHSKVTYIKTAKIFYHLKGSGYNTQFLLYRKYDVISIFKMAAVSHVVFTLR